MKIGVVGCGKISDQYFQFAQTSNKIKIISCTDQVAEKAIYQSSKYSISFFKSFEEMLLNPEIDTILNLTPPKEHKKITIESIKSSKHVYSEKPLGINSKECNEILEIGKKYNKQICSAPDTFLGAGIQKSKKMIEKNSIGQIVHASAFMVSPGHEHWHPNPDLYYDTGGGPDLDMAPYYLTTLIYLLGKVKRVTGSHKKTFATRKILSEPRKGEIIQVEAPTHISSILDFHNGVICTMIMSFDTQGSTLPRIELYGTEGTLYLPDPNSFGGPLKIIKSGEEKWQNIPISENTGQRGMGLEDMADSIKNNKDAQTNCQNAAHIVNIIESVRISSEKNQHIYLN